MLQEPLPDTTWIYDPGRARGQLCFQARIGDTVDTPEMRASTAVEGSMTTALIVEWITGSASRESRLENAVLLMAVGSGRPLDHAWRHAPCRGCEPQLSDQDPQP